MGADERWFCERCGDGPYREQISCQNCYAIRDVVYVDYEEERTPSSQATLKEAEGVEHGEDWYCENCGDGPYAYWREGCHTCGRDKSGGSGHNEDEGTWYCRDCTDGPFPSWIVSCPYPGCGWKRDIAFLGASESLPHEKGDTLSMGKGIGQESEGNARVDGEAQETHNVATAPVDDYWYCRSCGAQCVGGGDECPVCHDSQDGIFWDGKSYITDGARDDPKVVKAANDTSTKASHEELMRSAETVQNQEDLEDRSAEAQELKTLKPRTATAQDISGNDAETLHDTSPQGVEESSPSQAVSQSARHLERTKTETGTALAIRESPIPTYSITSPPEFPDDDDLDRPTYTLRELQESAPQCFSPGIGSIDTVSQQISEAGLTSQKSAQVVTDDDIDFPEILDSESAVETLKSDRRMREARGVNPRTTLQPPESSGSSAGDISPPRFYKDVSTQSTEPKLDVDPTASTRIQATPKSPVHKPSRRERREEFWRPILEKMRRAQEARRTENSQILQATGNPSEEPLIVSSYPASRSDLSTGSSIPGNKHIFSQPPIIADNTSKHILLESFLPSIGDFITYAEDLSEVYGSAIKNSKRMDSAQNAMKTFEDWFNNTIDTHEVYGTLKNSVDKLQLERQSPRITVEKMADGIDLLTDEKLKSASMVDGTEQARFNNALLALRHHDHKPPDMDRLSGAEASNNVISPVSDDRDGSTSWKMPRELPAPLKPFNYTNKRFNSSQIDTDNESVISSYANSVISTASLASSATDLSIHSKYSAVQIAQATKELIIILRDDQGLIPLYKQALIDDSIGPEKLERNLRRLFKRYAEALKEESGDTLQYQASRLVLLKARDVARSIIDKYFAKSDVVIPRTVQKSQEPGDDSDDESREQPVDESIFDDMTLFREFLLSSESLVVLRADIESFVVPKSIHRNTNTSIALNDIDRAASIDGSHPPIILREGGRCTNWYKGMLQIFTQKINATLLAVDLMEPPLKRGFTRLRWQCKCGDKLYDDVFEYGEGGITRMVERMQRSLGTKVATQTSSNGASTQRYTFRAPKWMRGTFRNLASAVKDSKGSAPGLPKHNQGCGTAISMAATVSPVTQKSLHLLACMQRGRYRREIDQSRVDGITTDQELFCSMKSRLAARRGLVRKFFTLRCVQGLYFVKFRLRSCNSAEVRDHEPCCTSSTPWLCECIPPATKVEPAMNAEYECDPAGPLDTYPPVMSRELMHMLSHPELIDKDETFVLKQLPKRTKGELKSQVGQPVEGWGIHYQEGWDFDIIIGIVFMVFFSGSLLFAILWSRYEYDLQGAFGVSSYIVTVVGILLACIVNRAGKLG